MTNKLKASIGLVLISVLVAPPFRNAAVREQARVKPVGHVVVVDSKGKMVGVTLGGLGLQNVSETQGGRALRPTVLLRVDEELAAVNVARDRFFGGNLYFESEDCAGNPWLLAEPLDGFPSPLLRHSAVAPPGQTLYLQAPGATPQPLTAKSRFLDGLACENLNVSLIAAPALPSVDLSTIYTPPFNLRAAP